MTDYIVLLEQVKREIRGSRVKATISANAEMVSLYWKIGEIILIREEQAGWGQKVVLRLVSDLKEEFPNMKSISPRNLRYMKAFAAAYPDESILQVALAKLTWYHHISLLTKAKDPQ
jgi:predicted nuclease of restriction endonuclease-like (RecB) superfamily